jgi:pyridoxal/pyridoxine/pyridoxamine kinase
MDYCVIAIEHHATILEEATGIAPDLFDADWNEVLKALDGEEPISAREPMRKLMASIRGTAALIDADRTAAMTAYLKRYTDELALAKDVDKLTRGTGDLLADALTTAHKQQLADQNQTAADKLSAVFELVTTGKPKSREDSPPPVAIAAEMRVALQNVGVGADDAVADALLRVV